MLGQRLRSEIFSTALDDEPIAERLQASNDPHHAGRSQVGARARDVQLRWTRKTGCRTKTKFGIGNSNFIKLGRVLARSSGVRSSESICIGRRMVHEVPPLGVGELILRIPHLCGSMVLQALGLVVIAARPHLVDLHAPSIQVVGAIFISLTLREVVLGVLDLCGSMVLEACWFGLVVTRADRMRLFDSSVAICMRHSPFFQADRLCWTPRNGMLVEVAVDQVDHLMFLDSDRHGLGER
mmetsp:Transcript_55452/g.118180  ORF Transcript_55452/g.118180 Transcript_55452/m.118180 type:complete len:239 (+) Transcript_55452:37-753(+)